MLKIHKPQNIIHCKKKKKKNNGKFYEDRTGNRDASKIHCFLTENFPFLAIFLEFKGFFPIKNVNCTGVLIVTAISVKSSSFLQCIAVNFGLIHLEFLQFYLLEHK